MSEYTPDKWVVVKITSDNQTPIHKVFACWYGGWVGSDSWKLNSGIIKATLEKKFYFFEGSSGSVYKCHEESYGTNMYGSSVLDRMIANASTNGINIEILPQDTNWLDITYE
jgi:hypothetical protein